ncbi:MAG: hypothetical protein OXT65_08310 [Alphaproteobacteria bacterium]|nr:hypothetical protein [Alphaproteobacteria bacterium]
MKNVFAFLSVLVLAGCAGVPVTTDIAACPATDLSHVVFFDGKPPGGAPVLQGPDATWTLPQHGDVYLECHYSDGFIRMQKMPGGVSSCTMTGKLLRCKAEI